MQGALQLEEEIWAICKLKFWSTGTKLPPPPPRLAKEGWYNAQGQETICVTSLHRKGQS